MAMIGKMYQHILLPIDLNQAELWDNTVERAVNYCQAFGSQLHVMAVLPSFGMPVVGSFFPKDFAANARKKAEQKLQTFIAERIPPELEPRCFVCEGKIYQEIIRYADYAHIDLIMMAARGDDESAYALGPNAERVVRHARQSVLVVREPVENLVES